MGEKVLLGREAFLDIANSSGLDTGDPHIEELYSYVKNLLAGLKIIEELDLTDAEPVFPYATIGE